MNKLIYKIASEKITTILSIVVISQLAVLVFLFQSPTSITPFSSNIDGTLIQDKNYSLSKTLYPKGTIENYVPLVQMKSNTGFIKSPPKTSTDLKLKVPKVSLEKENIIFSPTPTPSLPPYSSTVKGRDNDRSIISRLLADRISEYYSLYNKYPNIYSDKSKNELLSKPSHILYFYNIDENRTNSLALTLGDKGDSYQFIRSLKCSDHKPLENEIVFTFDEKVVTLCKEGGGAEEFAVMQ